MSITHDNPAQSAPHTYTTAHGQYSNCSDLRSLILGVDREVPLISGAHRPYINFDNAATTPPFRAVVEEVNEFLHWYGSVHRGSGYKSRVSTETYDCCREQVARWVGADPQYHVVIFTRSATDSINKVARTLGAQGRPLVLCTMMEHHSNLLPWRAYCRVDYVDVRRQDGALDLNELEEKLRHHRGAVRLVAVTAASNVTGLAPPLRTIARLAHKYGAQILVDGAQFVPHAAISVGNATDDAHFDYLVFSAHKMYAPFGVGVLVAPRATFSHGIPESVGGGTVHLVTPDEVIWADVPIREEPGTPNLVGAVALGKAIHVLDKVGMGRISKHERQLRAHMVERLRAIPSIRLYGDPAPPDHGQVSVIAFASEKISHGLMAAALGYEWGIGVRHGCFCAHPYLFRLLGLRDSDLATYRERAAHGDHRNMPGLVRISLGLYNTMEEVERVADAIAELIAHGPHAHYTEQGMSGEYLPDGCEPTPTPTWVS